MIAAQPKPQALLICNPSAGRMTPSARDDVAARLAATFELEVAVTIDRRHAIDLSRQAAEEDVPLVIALGGDGLVNEVANGIAHTDTALGIIPGGTMNVFARSLSIPRRASAAADHLVSKIQGVARVVDLGTMNGQFFTFAAGCGFDAEAAALVESDPPKKRLLGEPFFYWSALRVLAGAYRARQPTMTVKTAEGEAGVSMLIACNTGPYAYLLGLPIKLLPHVEPDGTLDVVALSQMRVLKLPWYAWRAVLGGSLSRHRDALSWNGVRDLTVTADHPFAVHVDGETLEATTRVEIAAAPGALRVFA